MNLLVNIKSNIYLIKKNLFFCISACQIDSQQSNLTDDTNMDIGEIITTEIIAASGEQRF
jgi:hypothetical protein